MTYKQFLSKLIYKDLYILSPHFDDAILSMGSLMYTLQGKVTIHTVNIFTQAHNGPYTWSAKRFIHASTFTNAKDLYEERNLTDKNALRFTGSKRINLGFQDALFRKKSQNSFLGNYIPEYDHVYPTYSLHIIRHVAQYDPCMSALKQKMQKLIPRNAVVFVPYGVGNHADHVITRNIARDLFPECFYYLDFPYTLHAQNLIHLPNQYSIIPFPIDQLLKTKLFSFYKSQQKNLFSNNNIPNHHELFLVPSYL